MAAVERSRNSDLFRQVLVATGKRETAYCTHLILAALLFSPFLLFGHILVADTDVLTAYYPWLLLAKTNFLHGSLGLWNPYSFSGIPAGVSNYVPILFPENWILFLVPLRFFFPAITFVAFVKMFVIGIAAYRFYCAELLNRRWALFASVTYQISGLVIFAIGNYVGLSIVLYYTILLALIWTTPRRSNLANYLLLSIVTTLVLMAGNVSHGAYALLGCGILILYRTLSQRGIPLMVRPLATFTASSATALLIFCVRLLPIIETVANSKQADCCEPTFANALPLIARFFDSEIFGVNYRESIPIFTNISSLYADFHLQWVMPNFFGVIAALLMLWALGSEKSSKAAFWSIYTVVALGIVTFAQPFETLVRALLSPIYHSLSLHFLLPVGFAAAAALGGMSFERSLRHGRVSRLTIELVVFAIGIAALFILLVIVRNVEDLSRIGSNWARFLVIGLVALGVLIPFGRRTNPGAMRALALSLLWAILAFSLVAVFFVSDPNPMFVSHLTNIGAQFLLFAGVAIVLALMVRGQIVEARRLGFWGGPALLALWLTITLYPWSDALQLTLSPGQSLLLGTLGALRFGLGVTILFLVLLGSKAGQLPARGAYLIFFFLLLAEQVPAGKIHGNINTSLFYSADTPYPALAPLVDSDGNTLDLASYRVNFPNTMLQLPFYREIWGPRNEICSASNAAYGIRSYGGYTDIVPTRTARFLTNWAEAEAPVGPCIYARQTDGRFLDLSGVGYAYDPREETMTRRPDALSRMMLFTRFDVIPDDQATLQRLKAADFHPGQEIVIQEDPGFHSHLSETNGKRLHFTETSPDHVEAQVRTDEPALLLFDDSFNPEWAATVNGVPTKLMVANYNFMAVPIPAGESHVVLEYRPRPFFIGAICAVFGLTMLVLALVVYLFRRWREGRSQGSAP